VSFDVHFADFGAFFAHKRGCFCGVSAKNVSISAKARLFCFFRFLISGDEQYENADGNEEARAGE
jgi:hypothetical protein